MARKQYPKYRGEQLLTRFLDFAYESQEVKPAHIALYAHILTTYNKLGWLEVFALPTDVAMIRSHISNRQTYYSALNDLFAWGWVKDHGKNGRGCRQISLLNGQSCDAYTRAISSEQPSEQASQDVAPISNEQSQNEPKHPDMAKFDRVFDAWAVNVLENDRRWVETMQRDTGIKNCKLAMSLFKEHIIRNSKVEAWLTTMQLNEKKSYFINSSRFFATDECRRTKEVVAKIVVIGGIEYVEQYGIRIRLPKGHKPQPDVNYYWDEAWSDWRMA